MFLLVLLLDYFFITIAMITLAMASDLDYSHGTTESLDSCFLSWSSIMVIDYSFTPTPTRAAQTYYFAARPIRSAQICTLNPDLCCPNNQL